MQTRFPPEALQDPDTAASNTALRACVHCGFCTATCPTYVLLGDERDSPRGRIGLIKTMLETGEAPTPIVVRHVDRCLTCLACATTCPSGVNYLHLIDHARAVIEQRHRRSLPDRALRAALVRVLPHRARLRAALILAQLARPLARLLPRQSEFGTRLRAMLALAPAHLPARSPSAKPATHPAAGERRARVALLAGCAQSVLAPGITDAAIRLLTRLGCEVIVVPGTECCGALAQHMGQTPQAQATMARTLRAWADAIQAHGLDAILITTSGCGTTVKEYGHLFRAAAPPLRAMAETVSAHALDITEWLDRLGYAPTRPPPRLRVAYHAACSLQHGQKVLDAPRQLLRRAGFDIVEPREAHLCCGSAGTYNLLQPAIAGALRTRKLANLAALEPDVIAAGNVGCLTQLHGTIPTLHTVELLDWMAGGPSPAALPASRRAPAVAVAAAAAMLAAAAPVGTLLDRLAAAPDETTAAHLEQQIAAAWHDAATDAVQVLEDQAVVETHGDHLKEALADSSAAIELAPEQADLWRRRGEIRAALGDDRGAAADLAQALSREPRLYPALAALSRLEEARGHAAEALAAWRRYLALDPHAPGGPERLRRLETLSQGQPL